MITYGRGKKMEQWKNINGYENLYQISNYGRIKSLQKWDVNRGYIKREKILKPTSNGKNYLIISLRKNKKRKNFYIHRLVAEHFIENPLNKKVINHKDYNTFNNHFENLEWVTTKENIEYSKCHMSKRKPRKTNTGYQYITYRKTTKKYRIVIDKKEYSFNNLQDAIKKRDEILKEVE